MKTVIIDGQYSAIQDFLQKAEMQEVEVVGTFTDGWKAMEFVQKNQVELVVLEIQPGEKDGFFLAKHLQMLYPDILLIFITETEKYAMEALRLHAVSYILRPYVKEELPFAIESAFLLSKRRKKKIFIKTFGHFDIFVNDCPIMFHSAKAKELLALLVDRQGGTVNTDQIICTLWEERPNDEATQSLCCKVVKNLQKELTKYGAEEILIADRGIRRVDRSVFTCDLYEMLNGNEKARKRFLGEYMLDYSWAEERMGQLNRLFYEKI